MNSPQDPIEDRFIDALLHEQARSNRESELQGIAAAIDAAPALTAPARRSPWSRRLAVAAACVSIGGIGFAILKSARRPEPLAMDRQSLRATDSSGALLERIRDQEDRVEDRRKVLATVTC